MFTEKLLFWDAEESSRQQPPPVPPRRKRGQNSSSSSRHVVKPERKQQRSAQPTAPQRFKGGRRTPNYSDCSSISTNPCDSLESNNNESRRSRSNSPFSKSPEPNEYPPLYFTLEDYKAVVTESIPPIDITFENDREEVYFRITTTDKPFEECLEEQSNMHDDAINQNNSTHVFEDYMDRSNNLNRSRITRLNQEFVAGKIRDGKTSSPSSEKSTPRVRFLIESPSTSTSDLYLENDQSFSNFFNNESIDYEESHVLTFEEENKINVNKNEGVIISELFDDDTITNEIIKDEIERRKTLIVASSINVSEEDEWEGYFEKTKINSMVKEKSEILAGKVIPVIEISQAEDNPPVSENVLRNFFLEDMLNSKDNSLNCAVIATHLKQDSTEKGNSKAIKSMDELSKVLKPSGTFVTSDRSVGEVKGDVLNELLTNFDVIKLKPVKTIVRRSMIQSPDDDDGSGVSSVTIDNKNNNDDDDASVEKKKEDKDTSAIIAREIDVDVKITASTTPVVISNDQSSEAVSIIPLGSVRSFVKYYEIQSEICSIAKLKDNLFKKHRSEHLASDNNDKNKTKEKSSTSRKKIVTKQNDDSLVDQRSSITPASSSKSIIVKKQSCLKTNAVSSPMHDGKKNVQFDKERTIVCPQKKDDEVLTSLIGNIKTESMRNKCKDVEEADAICIEVG